MPKTFVKALKNVKRVTIWGQLPDLIADIPDSILNTNRVIKGVWCGGGGYFALDEYGTILAWGDGTTDIDKQNWGSYPIPRGRGWVKIAVKVYPVIGLHSDGHIEQWADPFAVDYPPPEGEFTDIAIAVNRAVAVKSDGTLVTWGASGAIRDNVPSGNNFVSVACGAQDFAIALKNDGTVVNWGTNPGGIYDVPEGLSDVVKIAAGSYHSISLKSNGRIVSWGGDYYGEGTVPVEEEDSVFTDVSAGAYSSVALRTDGSILVWPQSNIIYTKCPKGHNYTGVFVNGSQAAAIKKMYTPKLFHYDSDKKKIYRLKVAKYDPDYTGDIEITFKGIITNPDDWYQQYNYANRIKTWTNPNKTFTVPHVESWTTQYSLYGQLYTNYRWGIDLEDKLMLEDAEFAAWDGWVAEFAPTNRWVQSDQNSGSIELTPEHIRLGVAGYLSLRWYWPTNVSPGQAVFAINSYGPAEMDQVTGYFLWSPRTIVGRPTVDVIARRRTWFANYGGPFPDRVSVKLKNTIKKQDMLSSSFELVSEQGVKKVFVYNEEPAQDWTAITFNDTGWVQGTGGVGFAVGEFKVGKTYQGGDFVMGHGAGSWDKMYECKGEYTPTDLSTRPTDGGGTEWADYWFGGVALEGGYFDMISTLIGREMYDVNASCCLRIPFYIYDQTIIDSIAELKLHVRYDDGFVAFLNGAEVARSNEPATLLWNSEATTAHAADSSLEEFNISGQQNLLVKGKNILAIQGLNLHADDPDFINNAKLVSANSARCFTSLSPYLYNTAGYGGCAEIVANGLFKDGIF